MRKPYAAPEAEFVRLTGDALTDSNPKNTENNSVNAKDIFEHSDDVNDWFLF